MNPAVEWCVDTRIPGSSSTLEDEICAHLDRHAVEPAVVELARPLVRQALEAGRDGPIWMSLDWEGRNGQLRFHPLSDGPLPGTAIGPGVTRAHDVVARLRAEYGEGEDVGLAISVARPPERDIDPAPADPGLIPDERPGHLIGLLAAAVAASSSLDEAAAHAGATLAAREALRAGPGGPGPDARRLAHMLVDIEDRLGGEFEVVAATRQRAELRNRRCPFGPATAPAMCRFTSALAGGLAARAAGEAEVNVVETLASGDHECRVVLEVERSANRDFTHRYTWPPTPPPTEPDPGPRGFQVTLSLQLPRDRLSVPVTRHLIRAAMKEVGVLEDDGDAVELAVTEACANVIDHSGPGDAYGVAVTIGPSSCHIRVVDIGRGFDHSALSSRGMAGHDAEHGRGVALMHALVDQVRFESRPEHGTVVHLVKLLHFDETSTARRLMLEQSSSRRDPGPGAAAET